jgi:hypothetical protein
MTLIVYRQETSLIGYNMILTFFLIAFTILGCTNGNLTSSVEVINLEPGLNDPTQIFLSQYATDVTYVSLEKNDDVILNRVSYLETRDSIILIKDGPGFFVFSETGSFMRRIGKQGRGPEEYNLGINGKIGEQNNIYINDGKGILEYNLNGVFQFRYPLFSNREVFKWSPHSWSMIGDSLVFVHLRNISGDEDTKALVLDKSGKVVTSFKNYNFYMGRRSTLSSTSTIYPYCGELSFIESFNDTLFRLNDQLELIPAISFNPGKFRIGYEEYYSGTLNDRQWARINDVFETENFLYIDLLTYLTMLRRAVPLTDLSSGPPNVYTTKVLGVYDKNSKALSVVEISRTDEKLLITGLFNDIDGGPKFYPKFRMGEDRFVMSIDTYDLKRYVESDSFRDASALYPEKKRALEQLANSLSESDNPVLMVVTMK